MSAARSKTPAIGERGWRPSKVHPAAAVFPMLSDPELDELAADIKANGLLHPIEVTSDGTLTDGRNRLDACGRGNVEPRFEVWEPQPNGLAADASEAARAEHREAQIASHIVSLNINRRHLKNWQRAMVLAMLDPEPKKTGRGKVSGNTETLSTTANISRGQAQNLISQARTVLRHSRDAADAVRDGTMPLDVAYGEAVKARQDDQGDAAKLSRLRSLVPDVAAMVEDERLSLSAGIAELAARQSRVQSIIDNAVASLQWLRDIEKRRIIIAMAFGLTDSDLCMVGINPADFDPLQSVPDPELVAIIEALPAIADWLEICRCEGRDDQEEQE